jgi:hypothetical protein
MIEPIKVYELDAGKPNQEMARFQMISAIKSANTRHCCPPAKSTSRPQKQARRLRRAPDCPTNQRLLVVHHLSSLMSL